MSRWLAQLGRTVKGWRQLAGAKNRPAINNTLWRDTLVQYPFLAQRSAANLEKLRTFAELFLRQKEFHGTQGLAISDPMAVAIAAQACLPILHWGTPRQALAWYGDFVGIVVHPDAMLARREMMDEAGVVHRYTEPLAGEAMDGGPVTLNWKDVASAGTQAAQGMNLVIHEFAHKIDMQSGGADGCPPLPPGFLGTASASAARRQWLAVMAPAYDSFREATILAERFGAAPTWLDPYGATSLPEFFAVACEAYFVNRPRFGEEFAPLAEMLDAFFNPGAAATGSSRR
jgi:Mlc titration factor MtfA (ptsG expression regulator)